MKKIIVLLAAAAAVYAGGMTFGGVITSTQQTTVAASGQGFVKEVFVSEGDTLSKGQRLYSIDTSQLDAQKTQTMLQVQQAEFEKNMYQNRFDDANRNYGRYKRLYAKDMVSKHELEQMRLKMQNAKSLLSIQKRRVQQAKASLQAVKSRYAYYELTAPVSGTVIEKNVKPGQLSTPGAPAVIISNQNELKLVADISQKQRKNIKKGMKVTVIAESAGYEEEASVTAVLDAADAQTHTFRVKITLEKTDGLYAGMYAKAVVKGSR
ncbi:MAG: efflux RND transporter periplasmic adaptor subunit [Campylobacterota bacterium]